MTPESSHAVIARGGGAAPRRGRLSGVVARTAARIRGSGLGQGFCRGLGQGLGRAINNAAFFALGAVICLLALYPDFHLAVLQALKDATEPLGHTEWRSAR